MSQVSVLAGIMMASSLFLSSCSKDKSTESAVHAPSVTTNLATEVTRVSAQCGGEVTSDGGAAVTSRGVIWSTNSAVWPPANCTSDGTGTGTFSSSVTGLTGKTTYYVAAYATNEVGTSRGSVVTFKTTDSTGTVTDADGNIYHTVKIGSQWWMAQNLMTTHYRNNDSIPNVRENSVWTLLATGAYSDYSNDPSIVATYGRLYNWYAVTDGRSLAPVGWHVASDDEWRTLVDYLGGADFAGGKMKETGSTHWSNPNAGATNESGFSGLPGGCRNFSGSYSDRGADAYFWTSTETDPYDAWFRKLFFDYPNANGPYLNKAYGFSVRCVRD
jgi:uncharacterized protein (TIGR02145 family)